MKKSNVLAAATIILMSLAGTGWTVEEALDSLPDPSQSDEWQTYDRFDIETTYPCASRLFHPTSI